MKFQKQDDAAVGPSRRGKLDLKPGDPAGKRTRLRTYWSNQHTGIVNGAVRGDFPMSAFSSINHSHFLP